MKCIYCSGETAVVDSRSEGAAIGRRRRCKACGRTFGTVEEAKGKPLAEGTGRLEALDRHLRAANLRMLQLQEELKVIRNLIKKG